MKILAFKIYTGVSHATVYINQSCVAALRGLGHTVRVVDLKEAPGLPKERMKFLGEKIIRFRPDLIFTINNQGIIPPLIEYLKIPYASWFVDTPFGLKREDASSYGAIFFWEKGFIQEFKNSNFRYVGYLPACTDPRIFKKMDLSQEDQKKFGCNISFVGNSFYSFYQNCWEEILKMDKNKGLRLLFEEVIRKKEEEPLKDIIEILAGLNINLSDWGDLESILQGASVSISRKAVLKEVRDFGLSIYGDEGWKELFINGAVNLYPAIDYSRKLPKLYNASKINLNISTPQRRTGLPPRIFDIMACGGFSLTDYLPELEEFFEIDREIIVYESTSDLRKKADYYLSHPEERQMIASRAKRRVLAEHTYRHRMERLVQVMREIFR